MDNSNPLANYKPIDPAQQINSNIPVAPQSQPVQPVQQNQPIQQNQTIQQNQPVQSTIPTVDLGSAMKEMTHEQINHIFYEINEMVAQIYQEFAKVNSAFGEISDFFFKSALELEQGRDPKYLSDDVKDLQAIYELLGLASRALGTAINAISSQAKYEMLKPSLKEHAQERIQFCKTVAQQLPHMVLNAYNDLQTALTQNGDIKTALTTYRKVRYHNLLLDHFIIPQYNDWILGNFSAEHNIPDMQDVNDELLFPLATFQGRVRNEVFITSLFNSTDEAVDSIKDALKTGKTSNKTLLLIQDSGLLATLQVKLRAKPFLLHELAVNPENQESSILTAFRNNTATNDNMFLANQVKLTEETADEQFGIYVIRNILILIALAIPAFTYLSMTWAFVALAVIIGIALKNLTSVAAPIETIKTTKVKRINTYAVTIARKHSGDTPELLKLSTIQKKNKSIFLWALVGAAAGFFLIPIPGGLIIGFLFGFLIGGAMNNYEEADRLTDGKDWDKIQFESTKWPNTISVITVIAIAVEIYFFFIK